MEYLTLVGIVIIVAGFALKLDVLAIVIISGVVTETILCIMGYLTITKQFRMGKIKESTLE